MDDAPFNDRHVPRVEIDWDRSCWWFYPLSRAIQPAMRFSSLLFSLAIVLVLMGGMRLGEVLFSPQISIPLNETVAMPMVSLRLSIWLNRLLGILNSIFQSPMGLREIAFLSFEFVWISVFLALGGGVLARRGMVEMGQRTVAPWLESIQLVCKRWQSFIWVSGMHVVAISLMLIAPWLMGWLANLGSVGATIAGVFLLLLFPVAIGVGRLCLSMLVCFPLAVCAISAETKADAFEGFSRSNAYFFQRPAMAVIYTLALILLGTIGEQIVAWVIG